MSTPAGSTRCRTVPGPHARRVHGCRRCAFIRAHARPVPAHNCCCALIGPNRRYSVVAGYLAGAALLIIASQVRAAGWPHFASLKCPRLQLPGSSLVPRPARCRQLAQARGRIARPPAPPPRPGMLLPKRADQVHPGAAHGARLHHTGHHCAVGPKHRRLQLVGGRGGLWLAGFTPVCRTMRSRPRAVTVTRRRAICIVLLGEGADQGHARPPTNPQLVLPHLCPTGATC